MADTAIKIEGMHCQHCVMNVKKALEALDGVSSTEVEIGSAKVMFDDVKLTKADIEGAIVKAGYRVAA
jgi:copper chaperone CopZ